MTIFILIGLLLNFLTGLIFFFVYRRDQSDNDKSNLAISLSIQSLQKNMMSLSTLVSQTSTSVGSIHKRIDGLFTVDIPSPNDPSLTKESHEDFNEQNMTVPEGVKFAIEGGSDVNIPPGFENGGIV